MSFVLLCVDGRNPAPPKKSRNDFRGVLGDSMGEGGMEARPRWGEKKKGPPSQAAKTAQERLRMRPGGRACAPSAPGSGSYSRHKTKLRHRSPCLTLGLGSKNVQALSVKWLEFNHKATISKKMQYVSQQPCKMLSDRVDGVPSKGNSSSRYLPTAPLPG